MATMAETARADAAFLRLDGVVKRFGGQAAVDGLSLAVRRGEFVSLLGPSGGGKTTTLHMIAGFIDPDAGDILLDGASLRGLPSHRRGAAMVFQSYALFPHMTVFDNVAFGLRMRKAGRAEIARRVGEALELVRLEGLGGRHPRELSGGQQQRVALARALVLEPRLLLLDEPLSNLDPRLRRELRDNFVDIHRRTGMTTLLVTHDVEEAFATSDRVAILGGGRLQQFDTPQAIYTRPRTAFVADFVGHGNVVAGRLERHAAGLRLRPAGGAPVLPLPAEAVLTDAAGEARYAIPAHALRLLPAGQGAGGLSAAEAAFDGCLRSLTYLGAALRFEVELHGLLLAGECAAGAWAAGLAPGAQVGVAWAVADMIPLPPPEPDAAQAASAPQAGGARLLEALS